MAVHRRPGAQDKRRGRLKGATIAGLVTLACLIAVPVELLELVLASIGVSELLPVLAPPIGLPVRIGMALLGAAIAAAIAWGAGTVGAGEVGTDAVETGGDNAPKHIKGAGPRAKRNGIMGWTRNLGLHHLARLARGEDGFSDGPAPVPPKFARKPMVPTSDDSPSASFLSRSRKDMHPDAPPRPPLFASRDLPAIADPDPAIKPEPWAGLKIVSAERDAAPPIGPSVSPIRDTTNEVRPRPLPRSPAPLSDSDISWVRGLLADRNGDAAQPAGNRMDGFAPAPATSPDAAVSPDAAPLPADHPEVMPTDAAPVEPVDPVAYGPQPAEIQADDAGAASLLSLVDRFEQSMAHRIALRDAANAVERVGEVTGMPASPAAAPADADETTAASQAVPLEMDDALNTALETLRKLSVDAKGR